nr:LysR substrate-binding domain-containing protein [Pseudomonas aegrilactucae]
MLGRLDAGTLDLAVVWGAGAGRQREVITELPMTWIGSQAQPVMWTAGGAQPVPLVLFDSPCPFHSMATERLEAQGLGWHMAFTSSSLPGLAAATQAGLGYTVRTRLGLQPGTRIVDERAVGLPTLPSIALSLCYQQAERSPVVERLAGIVAQAIGMELS